MQDALLWKLSYPNGLESYLFGTMHVRDRIAFEYADRAIEFMSHCENYYAEIDLKEAAKKISMDDYMLPGQLQWHTLLPLHSYLRMSKHCKRILNFNLGEWTRYYPLVVSNKIAEWLMAEDEEMALDAYLFIQAFRKRKKTGGVEPVEFQLKLMLSLDINEQLRMLRKLCRNLTAYRRFVDQLKEDYKKQDILALYKKSKKSLGSMKHQLLRQRNYTMAETISANNEKSSFYAIGAAHLAGPYGVLRLLKKQSIQLQALSI